MAYPVFYPLVKTRNIGHALVAFGGYQGPEIAFNWGGTGRGGSGSATGPATLARVPWSDARDYFVRPGDLYYVFAITNDSVDEAFEYAERRFDQADEYDADSGRDNSRHRDVDYNLIIANCVRFSYDVLSRAIPWWGLTPLGFTPGHFYSDLNGAAHWGMHGIKRTFTVERFEDESLEVKAW